MSYDIAIVSRDPARLALPWTTWFAGEDGFDWSIAAGDDADNPGGLSDVDPIESAIIVSLFTDRRAPDGWRPDVADRRGWWGDRVSPDGEVEDELGSHLWLLANEVTNERTRFESQGYARAALDWMIADGLAASVEVTADILAARNGIALTIVLRDQSGSKIYDRRFDPLWRKQR